MREHRAAAHYLPLSRIGSSRLTHSAHRSASSLDSRRGRARLVLATGLLACFALPLYLVLPKVWHSAPPPPSLTPPADEWVGPPLPKLPEQYIPPDEPAPAVAVDKIQPLHHTAFPPPYAADAHYNLSEIYPHANPHAGQLSIGLLYMLENPPVSRPPPRPATAPPVPADVWTPHAWDPQVDGSQSRFEDAARPDKHVSPPDFRSGTLYGGWRPPAEQLATPQAPLPRVQHAFPKPSLHGGGSVSANRRETIAWRQSMVRNAFLRSWEGYKRHAWGHDELKPVSNGSADPFNGWGATIVDALDTLLIMGLPREYAHARLHVRDIDFTLVKGGRSAYGGADGRIPVFETAIRYLGGLLSAHDLSGDQLMLHRAEELAQLILPAFDTWSGVPVGRLKPGARQSPASAGSVVLAEAGSMLLEFTRLYQATGNRTYFDLVQRNAEWIAHNISIPTGYTGRGPTTGSLLPMYIQPENGRAYGSYSFGAMLDSYYEYLIKAHQQLGGRIKLYGKLYAQAAEDAHHSILGQVSAVPNTTFLIPGLMRGPNAPLVPVLEHLACFTGGMLGLGARLLPSRKADLRSGERVSEACYWSYNSTVSGLGGEDVHFYRDDDPDRQKLVTNNLGETLRGPVNGHPIQGVRHSNQEYKGRPETIESVWYMYRLTGDPIWQERGWQMFVSWVTHAMTPSGFAQVQNVNSWPTTRKDSMESFVLAETFKYYFLLFSPPSLVSLDEYVLTTEAHPLLLPRDGLWVRPGDGTTSFWRQEWADPRFAPTGRGDDTPLPSDSYTGGEKGSAGGLTNVQKHALMQDAPKH